MKSVFFLDAFLSAPLKEAGPPALDPFAGWATPLTTILLVVLLIIIIWILLRMQAGQVEPVEPAREETHEHLEDARAAPASPDDLKVLEGVGPKVETVLQAAGIRTYAKLAGTAVEKLQAVLDEAGYQYMNPGSWPKQAGLADAGDWDALKKLQDELNAGRE